MQVKTQKATGKKVIRIYQKSPAGEEKLYQVILNVWNPDSGAAGKYTFRVFCKPNITLHLLQFDNAPIEYSIRGPQTVQKVPEYDADPQDLEFFLKCKDPGADLSSFLKISRDSDGNRVIKCQGNDMDEIGEYEVKLLARNTKNGTSNDEFEFQVVATAGIEVVDLPEEYQNEI